MAIPGGVPPLRAGQGHSFLLRRLHSLTGIIPVGAFLIEHILISNATAINGPEAYANQVKFLGNLPMVVALEAFGVWLPILFHGGYGTVICDESRRYRSCDHGLNSGRGSAHEYDLDIQPLTLKIF